MGFVFVDNRSSIIVVLPKRFYFYLFIFLLSERKFTQMIPLKLAKLLPHFTTKHPIYKCKS